MCYDDIRLCGNMVNTSWYKMMPFMVKHTLWCAKHAPTAGWDIFYSSAEKVQLVFLQHMFTHLDENWDPCNLGSPIFSKQQTLASSNHTVLCLETLGLLRCIILYIKLLQNGGITGDRLGYQVTYDSSSPVPALRTNILAGNMAASYRLHTNMMSGYFVYFNG